VIITEKAGRNHVRSYLCGTDTSKKGTIWTLSLRVSSETVEGKLLRGMSTNVVMPPAVEEFAELWSKRGYI
jgi:hypothetical protein